MLWLWIGFNAFVLVMLALDLGVFNRKAHAVSVKEAALWSVAWIGMALIFNLGLYIFSGPQPALEFLSGYLIEKSLSVDNIFIFVLIFSAFSVPAIYQHRVLFWGVLGALVMRGILIAVGATLIENFQWIIYIFGAFLIFTGLRMALHRNESAHPEKSPVIGLARRFLPVTSDYEGSRFFVRHAGELMMTPLMLVLLVIESSDLIFAVDSIPAVFAVTHDPFIIYTSNVFAILGLRSLYFVLAGVIKKFYYLQLGLAVILVFVGLKMLLSHSAFAIPTVMALAVIALVLLIAVIASLLRARRLRAEPTVIAESREPEPREVSIDKSKSA